jgi:hypothetical protein
MSRAYKLGLIDTLNKLNPGPDLTPTQAEKLSGADLEQLILAAENGSTVSFDGTSKLVGTNSAYPGTPSNAALSGSDLEYSSGIN